MAKVLPHFKRRIERVVLIPSKGGCFELKAGDRLLYSKLETGEFPAEEEMIRRLEEALG